MIEYIAVTNQRGERLALPLSNPYESGLAVMSVEGLGPVKGTINMTEISSSDGSIFNSSRLSTRNVTITLKAIPNYQTGLSVEDIRMRTYQFFKVKSPLTFEVKTDNRHVIAIGYVESNHPDIFSNEEQYEISILFPDPFFYEIGDGDNNQFSFSSKSGGFEFAFENESLRENLLQFAEIEKLSRINLYYRGDTESGVRFRLNATGDVRNITIAKPDELSAMRIVTDRFRKAGQASLISGDELVIDTHPGKKSATLIRNAKKYNVLHSLDFDVEWLKLYPGDNVFSYDAEQGSTGLRITIDYVPKYEGV